MKTIVTVTRLLSLLALAAVAPFAALVAFPGLNPTALVGGLAAVGVLAFAFSDYSRKPSFRVPHIAKQSNKPTPGTRRTPAVASCDWTYSTRAA